VCCLVSDTVCSSGYILRRIACLMNGALDRMWLKTVTLLFAQRDRVQSRGFAQTAPAAPTDTQNERPTDLCTRQQHASS
jgi:hypothetical protein